MRDKPDRRLKVHLPWKEDYFRHCVAKIRAAAGIDADAKFMGLRHGGNTEGAADRSGAGDNGRNIDPDGCTGHEVGGDVRSMTPMEWIALGGVGFTMISTVYAAVARGFYRVGEKFDQHEMLDQARHEQNVTRLTAIETTLKIVARNGSH